LKPDLADGWRLLADQLDAAGDLAGADLTRARYIKAATHDPRLLEAAAALVANDLPVAQARLAAHLQRFPTDIAALRMQAEVAARLQPHRRAPPTPQPPPRPDAAHRCRAVLQLGSDHRLHPHP